MMYKFKADTIIEAASVMDALYQLQMILHSAMREDNSNEILVAEFNMSVTEMEKKS